jgi:hypothetical protein
MYSAKKSEFTDKKIITVLQNKDSSITYSVNLSELLIFGKTFAEKIVSQMQAFSKTRAVPPVHYAHQLAKWGLCISKLKINIDDYDLDNSQDLDELHLIFLEWFFTDNPSASKCKLSTLKRDWTNIGGFIKYCQQKKVLPKWDWYKIPFHNQEALSQRNTKSDSVKIFGQSPQEIDHSNFFSKIITSESLAITTSEYLVALQYHLQTNLDLIAEVCYRKIDKIISDYELGCEIANQADSKLLIKLPFNPCSKDEVIIEKAIKRGDISLNCRYGVSLISPAHPNGLANCLWWIKNRLGGFANRNEVISEAPHIAHHIHRYDRIMLQRYLGTITHENLIYFVTLLIIKCREISNLGPVIQMNASNLQRKGNGCGIAIVDKGRVNEYKSDLLEPRLQRVMLFLKERTEPYRQAMKHDEKLRDALFIGLTSHTVVATPLRLRCVSATGKAFKRFLANNKEISHLAHTTYSMIRNSHAVIEFIRTGGDWHRVALTLGHQVSTSMRHYVPPEIKDMLRERKVRQFQNEMLLVATFDKNIDILDAVDFANHEELELFIINFIRIRSNNTDVLLRVLDKKISALTGDIREAESNAAEPQNTAFIPISETGLAALFRYAECIDEAGLSSIQLKLENHTTGIAPEFWCLLSKKLHTILTSSDYQNIEHKSIYKSALDRLSRLRITLNFKIQA